MSALRLRPLQLSDAPRCAELVLEHYKQDPGYSYVWVGVHLSSRSSFSMELTCSLCNVGSRAGPRNAKADVYKQDAATYWGRASEDLGSCSGEGQ